MICSYLGIYRTASLFLGILDGNVITSIRGYCPVAYPSLPRYNGYALHKKEHGNKNGHAWHRKNKRTYSDVVFNHSSLSNIGDIDTKVFEASDDQVSNVIPASLSPSQAEEDGLVVS